MPTSSRRRLSERAKGLKVGDPRDPETQIGPLVNGAALERVTEMVHDARAHGAQVLVGGEAEGPCFQPTVLHGVTPEMRVYGEESFGPLASIVTVDGVDEAVRVANDTEYGLAAAVFSQDVPAALEIAHRIESGICHVNDATVQDEPEMPFGGVKASGFGRFGGRAALEEFTGCAGSPSRTPSATTPFERYERISTTSSNASRSARSIHSSGVRRSGLAGRAG